MRFTNFAEKNIRDSIVISSDNSSEDDMENMMMMMPTTLDGSNDLRNVEFEPKLNVDGLH